MDPMSGRLYETQRDLKPGELISPRQLLAETDPLDHKRIEELKELIDKKQPLVAVSGEVAQKVQLGNREQRRRAARKRRRK